MTTPLIDAATAYLTAGLTVIALSGKQPNTHFHKRGLLDALAGVPENEDDAKLIEEVFTHHLTTGVGIVIEHPHYVVDVDGPEGARQFAEMLGLMSMFLAESTPTADTGRGRHFWFRDDTERHSTKLGPMLDIKGPGGYVAAPPSVHPSGSVYEWFTPLVDDESGQLVTPMETPPALRQALAYMAIDDQHFAVNHERNWRLTFTDDHWSITRKPANLSGLVKGVRASQPGERNNYLAWAAMTARDEGAPLATALTELAPAAMEAGLTRAEVYTTIRQAYRRRAK